MRNLGSLWERCNNGDIPNGEWDYERRLTIAGVVYNDDHIIKVNHSKGLVGNTFSVGNTVSSTIDAVVIPPTDHVVNRNDKILLELRIKTLSDGNSPWFEFGHYYIENASRNKDKWTIKGYDAMNKLETPFVTGQTSWPTSVDFGINHILNYLNISLDIRSDINYSLTMGDPTEYTMREVLGYIGGLHGGNWHITEENKLRLVIPGLGNIESEVKNSNTKKVIETVPMKFDKFTVKYGSSVTDKYTVGSGDNEFELMNPWGTLQTAETIRYLLQDYNYYPAEANSIDINPAIEIGDTISINGELVNLWQIDYTTRIYANISAPTDTEKHIDMYNFSASGGGGDYDDGDLQDRLALIENLLGISKCVLIRNEDLYGDEMYGYEFMLDGINSNPWESYHSDCIIIPNDTESLTINVYRHYDENVNVISVVGGTSITKLKLEASEGYNIDLSKLKIPLLTDTSGMLSGLRHVEEVIGVNSLDVSNVLRLNGMFYNLTNVEELDLSNWDTSRATHMDNLFGNMASLKRLDISSFDTSKVRSMVGTFLGMKSLQNVEETFSKLDTRNVEDFTSIFTGFETEEDVHIELDVSKAYSLSSSFRNSSFKSVRLNSSNDFGYVDNSSMFEGSDVESVVLPQITSADTRYGLYATFKDCINLRSITLPNWGGEIIVLNQSFTNTPNFKGVIDLSGFRTVGFNTSSGVGPFENCGASGIIISGEYMAQYEIDRVIGLAGDIPVTVV